VVSNSAKSSPRGARRSSVRMFSASAVANGGAASCSSALRPHPPAPCVCVTLQLETRVAPRQRQYESDSVPPLRDAAALLAQHLVSPPASRD
jgi:hypothetical protein